MAYTTFESDLLDASIPFAYIPTGAILTLAAPYSTLSDSDLASLGLLKCDGTLHLVATYPELYAVIEDTYGGIPGLNFNVPDLHSQKLTIKGSSNTAVVGGANSSNTHFHDIATVTWNSTNNNTVMTHSHNAYDGNRVFATGNPPGHSHDGTPAATPSINANTLINADANRNSNAHIWNYDSSSATNGNTGNTGLRQHAHIQNFNAYNTNSSVYTDHTHTLPATGLADNTQYNSTGTAFTNAHLHSTTVGTTNSYNSVTGYPIPYSPMLYFIKA
jgi:microcystin-dependent protein